ncbi:MAG: hypothetical protein HY718_14060 [Planctomycetes bacterium]|nr:hypothetical protein [Planctomycetota bacterium]
MIRGLVLWVLLTSSATAAGELGTIARWDFARTGDLEGWVLANGMRDVAVADGRLRLVTTNTDPFIFGPPISAPLDGCLVRVAIRCRHSADTQVYWTTDDDPQYGEQQVLTLHSVGFGALHQPGAIARPTSAPAIDAAPFTVLEFPIGKTTDAGRTLTAIRVDPCNGAVNDTVDIDFIEFIRQPPIVQARVSFDRHLAAPGERVQFHARVRQVGGAQARVNYTLRVDGGDWTPLSPTSQPAADFEARFEQAGVQQLRAMTQADGKPAYDLAGSIVVGSGETLPMTAPLRIGRHRLDFIRAGDDRVGAARWMVADAAGGWRLAGWLLPLVRLTVQSDDDVMVTREPGLRVHAASGQWARLEGGVADLPDWRVQVDFEAGSADKPDSIQITAKLTGPPDGKLLEFAVPVLRVDRDRAGDPVDRYGLFGGLEMLEPGWRSSSDRAVGERYATRWAPHPFKVALPAMAIEAAGLTTALFWRPMDQWDDVHSMPAATFASPNFLDGQPNHLMALSVPAIPEWRGENEFYARQPYIMSAGRPLTLRAVLYAERDLPVAMAARRWYELLGAPPPPPEPHDDAELYRLMARNYGDTMYWPEPNGWTHHWFFPGGPAFQPDLAAFLLAHAADTGDSQWVQRTKLAGRTVVDTAGTLAGRLASSRHAKATISAMRPDGTWPFRNTDEMRRQARQFTNGKYDSLGDDGATTLGTCATPALAILRQAEMSGDAELIAAGIRALSAMRQFRVPRGAQVWEVPLEVPDIRAAALAIKAYQIGYRLSGDASYLDDANYWAWTGMPFIYSWRVPADRSTGTWVAGWSRDDQRREPIPFGDVYARGTPQVTPYGTRPVLGTTFYVINWFGVLVQWCGLEWAQYVIELDADRPDPLLRYIADGVVISGVQQMADKPPWVGLYPDSWILERNIAQPALIYPGLILKCRQAQGRLPRLSEPWTQVLRDPNGGRRWHVSGWGRPVRLDPPGPGPWTAAIAFLAGQPNELILADVDDPKSVRIGTELLDRHAAGEQSTSAIGWRYDTAQRALLARFVHTDREAQIRIAW